MAAPPLHVIQSWMQAALRHPLGVVASEQSTVAGTESHDAELPIDDVVTRSRHLSASERLAIYSQAYFARLLECLHSEFPAVRHAAGDEAFAGLAWGYLQAWPSSSYTLSQLGCRFADYLRAARPARTDGNTLPDYADCLIDLARLERTYSEVFDAIGPESGPSLGSDELAALTPERFADSRLAFHETVRLMTLQFPCHAYASAVRQGREPSPLEPVVTPLVILRRDYVVRRFTVSLPQYDLLSRLQRGDTIGDALAMAARESQSPETLLDDVRRWFAEWTAARLFRAVVAPASGL